MMEIINRGKKKKKMEKGKEKQFNSDLFADVILTAAPCEKGHSSLEGANLEFEVNFKEVAMKIGNSGFSKILFSVSRGELRTLLVGTEAIEVEPYYNYEEVQVKGTESKSKSFDFSQKPGAKKSTSTSSEYQTSTHKILSYNRPKDPYWIFRNIPEREGLIESFKGLKIITKKSDDGSIACGVSYKLMYDLVDVCSSLKISDSIPDIKKIFSKMIFDQRHKKRLTERVFNKSQQIEGEWQCKNKN